MIRPGTLVATLVVVLSLLCTGAAATARAHTVESHFQQFVIEHGKTYANDASEWAHRLAIFTKNHMFVEQHNARNDTSHKVALNKFADLTGPEFAQWFARPHHSPTATTLAPSSPAVPPSSVDWRTKGVVVPVGNCGAMQQCAAIPFTATLTAAARIRNGDEETASTDEASDCCFTHGGLAANFSCVVALGGFCAADAYHSGTGACQSSSCTPTIHVSANVQVPPKNEPALTAALAQQPIMVAIDASRPSFQLYTSGVYSDPDCSASQLDHMVTLVGYGVDSDSGTPYYTLQNEWGSDWGEQGYMRIRRGTTQGPAGECGVTMAANYPTIA